MVGAGNLDFVNSFSQDRFSGKDKSYDKAQNIFRRTRNST